jgi:hypothetical protein
MGIDTYLSITGFRKPAGIIARMILIGKTAAPGATSEIH